MQDIKEGKMNWSIVNAEDPGGGGNQNYVIESELKEGIGEV